VIALVGSVIAASVLGSLHCAVMCGPLTSLYLDPTHAGRARLIAPLAHALGRLGAYVTLGAIAGGVGSAIDLAGRAASVQRAAMVLAAGAVVAWGTLALASALGVPVPSLTPRTWNRALVKIRRRRPTVRAALIGLLTAALPCGWLWAFVMVSAGTGGVLAGATVMTAFWLGTLPMMLGFGVLAAPLIRRVGARLPLVTALALIAVGVTALAVRAPLLGRLPTADAATTAPTSATCHAPGANAP
jgi:uncharacterized protein